MSDDAPKPATSLDLLNAPTKEVDTPAPTSTEEYLSNLTVALFDELLNKQNYDNPLLRYWDTQIEQDMEVLQYGRGQHDLVDNIKAMHRACPNYHAQVVNTSVKFSSRSEKATVWVLQIVTGLPDGVRKESVNELIWVRKDGDWFCVNHRGLRGLVYGLQNEFG